jgi:hypothetical protein
MLPSSPVVHLPRLLLAGFAAGCWVLVSGLAMAAAFGYGDMKAAFDAIGLKIPFGAEPFVVHTAVRLLLGMAVVTLFAVSVRVFSPARAWLFAAAVTWLLASVLPFAVIMEWGLFRWPVALRLWAWSAMELLIAGAIGSWIYLRGFDLGRAQ